MTNNELRESCAMQMAIAAVVFLILAVVYARSAGGKPSENSPVAKQPMEMQSVQEPDAGVSGKKQ
jgi:hypothetical protein